jgi:hypothetical protein
MLHCKNSDADLVAMCILTIFCTDTGEAMATTRRKDNYSDLGHHGLRRMMLKGGIDSSNRPRLKKR